MSIILISRLSQYHREGEECGYSGFHKECEEGGDSVYHDGEEGGYSDFIKTVKVEIVDFIKEAL